MGTSSVWFDSPSPPLEADDISAVTDRVWDLVVVGGGIVGLLSALTLRRHGRDVCLLDAGRVGEATTAHATVKVTSGHGAVLADIATRHGRDVATAYQRANDAGFAQLSALVGSLPEDVGWTTSPHIVYSTNEASFPRLRTTAVLAMDAGSAIARSDRCSSRSSSGSRKHSWTDFCPPVACSRTASSARGPTGGGLKSGAHRSPAAALSPAT